jgi:hypothetical protein
VAILNRAPSLLLAMDRTLLSLGLGNDAAANKLPRLPQVQVVQ